MSQRPFEVSDSYTRARETERLRAALHEFGRHKPGCDRLVLYARTNQCSCGFSEALTWYTQQQEESMGYDTIGLDPCDPDNWHLLGFKAADLITLGAVMRRFDVRSVGDLERYILENGLYKDSWAVERRRAEQAEQMLAAAREDVEAGRRTVAKLEGERDFHAKMSERSAELAKTGAIYKLEQENAALKAQIQTWLTAKPATMSVGDGRLVEISAAGMRQMIDERARFKAQAAEAEAALAWARETDSRLRYDYQRLHSEYTVGLTARHKLEAEARLLAETIKTLTARVMSLEETTQTVRDAVGR